MALNFGPFLWVHSHHMQKFGRCLIPSLDNTTDNTVYETAMSYNVTAGVGPFNGTLVRPFLDFLGSLAPDYPYTTVPYSYYAMAGSLVTNPTFGTVAEPVHCRGDGCYSYLLSGGVEMAIPGVPHGYTEYPLVRIADATAIQMEFTELKNSPGFDKDDCSVYGAPATPIGIELCLAQRPNLGGLQAGRPSPRSLSVVFLTSVNRDILVHKWDNGAGMSWKPTSAEYHIRSQAFQSSSIHPCVSIEPLHHGSRGHDRSGAAPAP